MEAASEIDRKVRIVGGQSVLIKEFERRRSIVIEARERLVVELVDVEGLTRTEVAKRTGISPSRIGQIYNNGKEKQWFSGETGQPRSPAGTKE